MGAGLGRETPWRNVCRELAATRRNLLEAPLERVPRTSLPLGTFRVRETHAHDDRLLLGSFDGRVRLYVLPSGPLLADWAAHGARVEQVLLSDDTRLDEVTLLTMSAEELALWGPPAPEALQRLRWAAAPFLGRDGTVALQGDRLLVYKDTSWTLYSFADLAEQARGTVAHPIFEVIFDGPERIVLGAFMRQPVCLDDESRTAAPPTPIFPAGHCLHGQRRLLGGAAQPGGLTGHGRLVQPAPCSAPCLWSAQRRGRRA